MISRYDLVKQCRTLNYQNHEFQALLQPMCFILGKDTWSQLPCQPKWYIWVAVVENIVLYR